MTPPAPSVTFERLAQAVGGRGASRQPARYAYLHKIDGHLQDVAASGRAARRDASAAALRQGVAVSASGDMLVDVYVRRRRRVARRATARARHAT